MELEMHYKLPFGIDCTIFIEKLDLFVKIIPGLLAAIVVAVFQLTLGLIVAWAGPPFVTDDPEPVEYRHWEIYLASQHAKDKDGWSGTAPHFEVNYGALPNLQLHLIAPLAYVKPEGGSSHYGFGDLELGAKYRFIQETDWRPMVGTFPIFDLPTGSSSRGLGSGQMRTFLPIWLQKNWGPWTTYGGGGYLINPGSENKDYWYAGGVLQRDLSEKVTLGGELFYTTPKSVGEGSQTGFNVGGIFNFSEEHHLLFSAGRDIHGPDRFLIYIGYQLTFGPREEKKEAFLSFIRNKIPSK
jgi:hypothetical protein